MNILHVDDSPEICQLYSDMLSMDNHNVESVNDGREGLECALKNNYDLILLDVCMPKYSGMEFIHDLKANGIRVSLFVDPIEQFIEGVESSVEVARYKNNIHLYAVQYHVQCIHKYHQVSICHEYCLDDD